MEPDILVTLTILYEADAIESVAKLRNFKPQGSEPRLLQSFRLPWLREADTITGDASAPWPPPGVQEGGATSSTARPPRLQPPPRAAAESTRNVVAAFEMLSDDEYPAVDTIAALPVRAAEAQAAVTQPVPPFPDYCGDD